MNVISGLTMFVAMVALYVWTWFDERFVTPASRRVPLSRASGRRRRSGKRNSARSWLGSAW